MSEKNVRKLREESEYEYQLLVERIANRVWEIMKQNARLEKERRGSDRGARNEH